MSSVFKVKSARVDALSLMVQSPDIDELKNALNEYFLKNKDMCMMPFLLDLHELADAWALRIDQLLPFLQEHKINIVGVRHSDESYAVMANKHGLSFALLPSRIKEQDNTSNTSNHQTANNLSGSLKPCIVIDKPVRSGQQVYAEDADLIITSIVGESAEVIADGHIHVYGPLRGRALAGASGNREARIFTQSMQAQLVSIAGVYRTFDRQLPAALHKKPVTVSLQEERLLVQSLINETL